jgi:hypothetical protein
MYLHPNYQVNLTLLTQSYPARTSNARIALSLLAASKTGKKRAGPTLLFMLYNYSARLSIIVNQQTCQCRPHNIVVFDKCMLLANRRRSSQHTCCNIEIPRTVTKVCNRPEAVMGEERFELLRDHGDIDSARFRTQYSTGGTSGDSRYRKLEIVGTFQIEPTL